MKKIFAVLLSLTMLFALCIPAFAEADPVEVTTAPKNTIVKISTLDTKNDGTDAENFKVKIPADATMRWGDVNALELPYSIEAHMKRGKALHVKVTGDGKMDTTDNVYHLSYTLGGDVAFDATSPVVFDDATADHMVKKVATVSVAQRDWDHAIVETYSDNLTFAVTVTP